LGVSHPEAELELAQREESLAALLMTGAQARERLRLLQEANTIRQALARNGPNPRLDRVHLMRSHCRIADAELALRGFVLTIFQRVHNSVARHVRSA
jgi:hypothetical protein